MRGPGMFRGYLNRPEATEQAMPGGWLRTGDLCRQDERGFLYFMGRKKDIIRRSGMNLTASEVEDALRAHPMVLDAAVIPVPDRERGEEVKAYLLLADGKTESRPARREGGRVLRRPPGLVQGAALHRVPGHRLPADPVDAGPQGGAQGRAPRPDRGLLGPRPTRRPMAEPQRACDVVIRHGYVITMNPDRTIYADGAVAIAGREIVMVGPDEEVAAACPGRETIDAQGAPVHPGFVDAHWHNCNETTRGVFPDVATTKDYYKYYAAWYDLMSPADEHASAQISGLEMLRSGITCFMEPGTAFDTDAVADAAVAVGIRASLSEPFLWDISDDPMLGSMRRTPGTAQRCSTLLGRELWRNELGRAGPRPRRRVRQRHGLRRPAARRLRAGRDQRRDLHPAPVVDAARDRRPGSPDGRDAAGPLRQARPAAAALLVLAHDPGP